MEPRVSIVMTVHNAGKYLREAIGSVQAQTFREFELIVWDDGSTDGSLDIARQLAASDERLQIIAAEHKGRGPALAEACALERGEYVAVVDADDLLEPTALEECVAHLGAQPDVGMVYTDHLIIDADGNPRGLGHRCRIPYSKERLLLNFMTFHFRLIRRGVYEQAGGFAASYPLAMDYDLCLRLSEITRIDHLKSPLYRYRRRRDSLSATCRIEQAQCSHRAINAALERRGMAGEYVCDLEIQTRYRLRRTQHGQAASASR